MSELDKLKSARAGAKRAVTCAIRKLDSSLRNGLDSITLKDNASNLETLYDTLMNLHLEYCELNGEDDDTYLNSISKEYDSVFRSFAAAMAASNKIELMCKANPLRKAFNRSHARLTTVLNRLDANLGSDDNDINSLQADKDEIDTLVNSLLEDLAKLAIVIDTESEDAQTDTLVVRSDELKRRTNIRIRHIKLPLSPLTPLSGLTNPSNVEDTSQVMYPHASEGTQLVSAHELSQTTSGITTTSILNTPLNVMSHRSTLLTGTASSLLSGATTTNTPSALSNGALSYPTSLLTHGAASFFENGAARRSLITQPNGATSHQTSAIASGASGFASTSVLSSRTQHFDPLSDSSFAQMRVPTVDPVGQVPTLDYSPHQGAGASPYGNQQGQSPWHESQLSSVIHTKRPSLPSFSGSRSDWPEFKCVWRSLAESQFSNKMQLAMELKKACSKGRASDLIKNIYVTAETAYDEIWSRLSEVYDDPGLSVQSAMTTLASLKPTGEDNFKSIVHLIDVVEGVHNQLRELSQLDSVHMVDIDRVNMLLPRSIGMEWIRRYHSLPDTERIHPFPAFVQFLVKERSALARLAEAGHSFDRRASKQEGRWERHTSGTHAIKAEGSTCAIHGNSGHTTLQCRGFKFLSLKQKYNALRRARHCFRCLEAHPGESCSSLPCSCGQSHHELLCKNNKVNQVVDDVQVQPIETHSASAESHLVDAGTMSLYPIHKGYLANTSVPLTVFADAGSNATYITERCAIKHNLKRLKKVSLDVTTVGGEETTYESSIYEVPLRMQSGRTSKLLAYGLSEITGPLSQLDKATVQNLFPAFDAQVLMRPSSCVDILLGTDYFGLHPKHEIAKAGEHLSIMQGELGVCLVGTHPKLKESTMVIGCVPKQLNASYSQAMTHHAYASKSHPALDDPQAFIVGEELGTEIVPKCGGCKCGKCPIPGHNLSFREEQELHIIRTNLQYDAEKACWITSYPWLVDPAVLPDNFSAALATLKSTEKSLSKDPSWAKSYSEQIHDMVDRGAARKLTLTEVEEWEGPKFYLSHLAVANPKSNSTPVRIVFNSSQPFRGISLNSCLAKGPDSYVNNSLGILLRWREEDVAIVGDIKKMFHSIFLNPLEQHCHRFLWRDLVSSKEPDVYVMERVNMGDRPASAIASEVLYMTADLASERLPEAAEFVKGSSYMDDLIDSVNSVEAAVKLAKNTEELLQMGGFKIKCWQLSGKPTPLDNTTLQLKGDETHIGVLGVAWEPKADTVTYKVTLNFSKKKRGVRTEPNIQVEQVPEAIPQKLTRRLVLQQVMNLYDPMGLVSPFMLLAKIYLRETWAMQLSWDEELPLSLHRKWVAFFTSLFGLEKLSFPRCLRPANAEGQPWLVLLSDGSDVAYGCAAYVRWGCTDGSFESRLIMSKSRIAPVSKVSIPRMELNGAVLSKRCRSAISKEMRYQFERVIHLVDSETVLSMLKKTSYRFKVYEGVRVGEIQAATNGDMNEWAWMPGADNTADWLTRGRHPSDLERHSEWFKGPPMLSLPFEQWPIKSLKSVTAPVPEEMIVQAHVAQTICNDSLVDCTRMSSLTKALRVAARLINIAKHKSFKGGSDAHITPTVMCSAELLLAKQAQATVDLESSDYRRLTPAKRADGVWVVGASRLAHHNPMNVISADLPIFLPKGHPLTHLAMRAAHANGHRGRDATLAAFRSKYWTPGGPSLARSVKGSCQLCRLRDKHLMEQEMGSLPADRLKPSPPFNHVMVDLFGPYTIRGEVQKRINAKAWGIIFADMCSRAIHIESVFGYDTSNFLLGLSRFASLRGWPERVYSDPGTQLVAASKEINEAAKRMGTEHGMEWVVGPADSPWHQGAVEALVKSTKKALDLAIHNQRLSASEFLTVCTEAANTVNERPVGLLPHLDSDINVLTPNCLLLGRATAANPNNWQPGSSSLKTRYHLVCAVGEQFWRHWVELLAPTLVYRPKWFDKSRDLQVGDVVLVADSNAMRGEYRLALVTETYPGKDGHVRHALVTYKRFKTGEAVSQYHGAASVSIKRSVQRLVLLVPIEDQ